MSENATYQAPKTGPTASQLRECDRLPGTARIGFIYGSRERHVSERYLVEAFEPGEIAEFDLNLFRPNVSADDLVRFATSHGEKISHLVQYVGAPGLPRDLHHSPLPTACLNIDTFSWMESRLRWAMLFDHVFVWQPRFVSAFQNAGHPSVFLLPHAVDVRLFNGMETDRCFDLGWVGHIGPSWYGRRNRIIPDLAARFRMNDFRRRYTREETAQVYRQSRIVVNVTRDEFPPEANMRCYEAMAGGALLITPKPTELTELGFREGEHFIGWRNEAEIVDLVRGHLSDEATRRKIARAGQDLVLREHTFERRKETLRSILLKQGDQFFAPARRWPEEKVQLTYLEYYYRHQIFSALFQEFSRLGKTNRGAALRGAPMVLKALRHGILRSLDKGGAD
jgi:glycosyl transferase family 1